MSSVAGPGVATEIEVRRLRTLYHLLAALSHARGLEDVYSAALTSLVDATVAERAAILLFDDDGIVRFKASRGLSEEYQAMVTGHSPWPRGTTNAEPVVVPDVMLDESLAGYRVAFERENIRALAFVPLALDEGVFGKFVLYFNEPHNCTGGEIEISQAIAAHVALATDHKRTELACARSERRLQAILDNSSTLIFLKDVRGTYLLVNRGFEDVFHVSRQDVIGRTDRDIFPAPLAAEFQANDRKVLAEGRPLTLEEYVPHDDGIHTYVSLKFPLEEPDGTITGVCGISTDISERKEAEAASRRLAAIVESSEDAIIGKNAVGIITSWNKGAERTFGYTASEVIGSPVSILAAPDRLDEMPGILSKVLQGEYVQHYETRRRRKDGRIIDIALSVSPVRDAAGRIVGASKIARDISDRKLAEQERAALLAREQEARRTAELLNRVGPRLAAQLDLKKLLQEVIDIATVLVGAETGAFLNDIDPASEHHALPIISSSSGDVFLDSPLSGCMELFGPIFRGEGLLRSEDVTQDARCGNSPPSAVRSFLAAPVIARSAEVLGGLFFGHSEPGRFNDLHEKILTGIAAHAAISIDNARLFEQTQSAQAELKTSNQELRRANQDLEVFAYSASHDLQEPLRTISISAQLIERTWGRELRGDDAEFLKNIISASKRMSSLIKDLLAYAEAAKYSEGQAPLVDSGRTLATVLEDLRGLIHETNATVTSTELPPVTIHEGRLAQIFQNLISNAIKYRGKEVPRVEISAASRDGWCTFSVSDNGIGIEPEYAERIFELFKRLHGRDEYPGSGIGLAICRRVVERYGGRIWLERSTPGGGSVFCFSLPLRS